MNFIAKIRDGRIIPEEPLVVNDKLKSFHEKDVEISIKKTNSRSNPQNRYYWGVIVHMIKERFEELGYTRTIADEAAAEYTPLTRDDVHLFLRNEFLLEDLISGDGEIIGKITISTKELSTDEFVKYLDNVRNWAADALEIQIPDPEVKILYNIEVKDK
tara:strand:+ start:734 stop:1210 length:477 start_codon:yes stop_codon:yes gene_type:complete